MSIRPMSEQINKFCDHFDDIYHISNSLIRHRVGYQMKQLKMSESFLSTFKTYF